MIGKTDYKTTLAERERKRRYYLENKDRVKAKNARWKQENPDAVQEHTATYRERWRLELRIKESARYHRSRAQDTEGGAS